MSIEEIAKQIATLVEKKDKDYGKAFDKSMDKFGDMVYVIRLEDKVNRVENIIMNHGYNVVADEKVEDTVKDIIGYSLLFLRRLSKEREWIDEHSDQF